MRRSGIGGPYGLAIGPEIYTGIVETTEHGGHLLFDHLRRILGGPLVWAPGCPGRQWCSACAVATSSSIAGRTSPSGIWRTTPEVVRLYVEESLSFRCHEPDAAVALRRAGLTSDLAETANRVRVSIAGPLGRAAVGRGTTLELSVRYGRSPGLSRLSTAGAAAAEQAASR